MIDDAIGANLREVESHIAEACRRAGRARAEVRLIAVSKTLPAGYVDAAISLGVTDVGENRVQELRDKVGQIRGTARWHMIGHLQSNKAKDAVRLFDVIHTVDSVELAEKLERECAKLDRTLEVLVQVNVGGEEQKSGVGPEQLSPLIRDLVRFERLRLAGLMTIPPIAAPEQTRHYFRMLRELRDRTAAETGRALGELSMGMSDDYPIAIEEGATMIRVGRSIFGERGAK